MILKKSIVTGVMIIQLLLLSEERIFLRGPYLQMGTPNQVTVCWQSDEKFVGKVFFGLAKDTLNLFAQETTEGNKHTVTLTGLTPHTKYFYQTGRDGVYPDHIDENQYFITSPEENSTDSVRMWVIGDSGTGNQDALAVYNAYLNNNPQKYTNLWLMLGDNAYVNGTDSEYQAAIFEIYPELLRTSVLWATPGNHDVRSANLENQRGPYFDIFNFPTKGEAGGVPSGTESYYSFNYGQIHFISLNSCESDLSKDGEMYLWLEQDLIATGAKWNIIFFHHPPYTKGSHDSDDVTDSVGIMQDMRVNFLPLIEQHGVDLVLTGHSHSYERSYLIDGHYGDSNSFDLSTHALDQGDGREDGIGPYQKATYGLAGNEGAVYICAGNGGKVSDGSFDHPAMYASSKELGSLIIDIEDNRLHIQFINEKNEIRDHLTIIKKI